MAKCICLVKHGTVRLDSTKKTAVLKREYSPRSLPATPCLIPSHPLSVCVDRLASSKQFSRISEVV